MSKIQDLNEVIEEVSYDSDFFKQPFLDKLIVSEPKIETLAIEKLTKYSSTELGSNFLEQLKKVKEIKNKEVQELILMLDVYAGTVNDIILDFEEDNILATTGDKVFYTSLLESNKEEGESRDLFVESTYRPSDILSFRLQALADIEQQEKEDDLYKKQLDNTILNITDDSQGNLYGEEHGSESDIIRLAQSATERVRLNIDARKKQRHIDLAIKTKRMEFLI